MSDKENNLMFKYVDCRTPYRHPETPDEFQNLVSQLIEFNKNDDRVGVFRVAMQLIPEMVWDNSIPAYYLLRIWGDVEPEDLIGPFKTEEERDERAADLFREDSQEKHGLFRMDVKAYGPPDIYPYSGAFSEEARSKVRCSECGTLVEYDGDCVETEKGDYLCFGCDAKRLERENSTYV